MWRASARPFSAHFQVCYNPISNLRFSCVVHWQQNGRLQQPALQRNAVRTMNTEAKPPKPAASTLPPSAAARIPTGPPPKRGGVLGKLFGLILVGGAGTVAYAWYDASFKKQITDNVPYSKEALDYVFSYLPSVPATDKAEKTAEKKGGDETPKGLARTIKVPEAPVPKLEPLPKLEEKKALTAAEQKALKEQEARKKKEEEAQKKAAAKKAEEDRKRAERERIEKAARDKEDEIAAENAALVKILTDLIEDTSHVVKMAADAQRAAADTVRQHTQQVKDAMHLDENVSKEQQWEAATASNKARTFAVESAEEAVQTARMQIEKLLAVIQEGKMNTVTKKNKMLREAEKQISDLTYTLNSSIAENTKAQSAAKVMSDYRDLVKKGKAQFKEELESIMPEVKLGNRRGGKLTEEELNSLIAHAHRRIEQLQKQLAEQQAMERQRIDEALENQKLEDDKLADLRVDREMQRMLGLHRAEKQTWDVEARVQFEQELREHLSRQAAAHSDHLAEVLKVQDRELRGEFNVELSKKILEERDNFQAEVAGWVARLKGIEAAVEGRAEMEKIGRKAQELWLACQSLQTLVQLGREGATTWESQLQPLEPELKAIADAGDSHPFVNTVIDSIAAEAAERGVWTQEALTERFSKVRRVCRRVAMIGDEGASSLMQYMLSYLQSLFVFSAARPISDKDEIDLRDLSTFVLVDNAYYCLERGDLQQAVKYVNQLKGEARHVASDWLKEARLLLETQQAADALLAHASACGLGSLF